jgi:hypothetical protein
MTRRPGDHFIITKVSADRKNIPGVPEDAVGRVATLVEVCGSVLVLSFPNGVQLKDGPVVNDLEVDEASGAFGLEKVKLITEGYEPGPYPGTVLLDVDKAYKDFWHKFAAKDPRRSHHGHMENVADSIRQEGLRHPIILNNKLELRVGAYRLAAYHNLGKEKIEAYITDTDKTRTWRL